MSADLYWMIVRNNNSYLMKKRNVKMPFSKEQGNLKNVSAFRYSGLVHSKTIDIQQPVKEKGFVVYTKRASKNNKPRSSHIKVAMTAGPRRSLYKLRRYLNGNNYRKDLVQTALKRASSILESQKRSAIIAKKNRVTKKSD